MTIKFGVCAKAIKMYLKFYQMEIQKNEMQKGT